MKNKRKKQVATVVVLLFFLAAGLWYFYRNKENPKQQPLKTPLKGVLELADTDTSATTEAEPKNTVLADESPEEVVVYVCGAVKNPGVYTLAKDSRLYEAVMLAGGFSAEADPAYHNLARCLSDGERIYILSGAETILMTTVQQVAGEEGAATADSPGGFLLNLNTATKEQLMELPGIGEARAADILEYRARIGQFSAIEEIMNVSGIGEAMFAKMKEKITVK